LVEVLEGNSAVEFQEIGEECDVFGIQIFEERIG
jgi:hypothetical protein